MTRVNKILLGLLLILLLITIGEIFIYYTGSKNAKISKAAELRPPGNREVVKDTPPDQAVGENIIYLLREYKKSSPIELTLLTTYNGEITKISKTPSVVESNGASMQAQFYIVLKTAIGEDSVVFPKEQLDKIYFTSEGTTVKLDNPNNLALNVGDTIKVQYSYNLKTPDPKKGYLERIEIIKM